MARNEAQELQALSDILLQDVLNNHDLRVDQDGNPCAVVDIGDGYRKLLLVESKEMEDELRYMFHEKTGQTISKEPLNRVIATLSMLAKRDEVPPITVGTRIMEQGNALYYNIDNKSIVRVNDQGVKRLKNTMNKVFLKKSYPQVQPNLMASAGMLLGLLAQLIRAASDDLLLLAVWLCTCFVYNLSHPILILHGLPGSSKTTILRTLARLVDPDKHDLLTMPDDRRSLVSTLSNRYFIALDNLRKLTHKVSDILCSAVTGGYESMRKLFSTNDNMSVSLQGCIAVNGVENVVTERDLLDRGIIIQVDRIPAKARLTDADYWLMFEKLRPDILGSIFDVLSKAMLIRKETTLPKLSRMADFEIWGYCIAESLGEGLGDRFLELYTKNQNRAKAEYKTDILVTCLVEYMRGCDEWKGRTNDLYHELAKLVPAYERRNYPNSTTAMSRNLNSFADDLEGYQITFKMYKDSDGNRCIKVCNAAVDSKDNGVSGTNSSSGTNGNGRSFRVSGRRE